MNEKEIRALVQAELSSYDLSREVQVEIPDEAIEQIAERVAEKVVIRYFAQLLKRIETLEAAATSKPAGGRLNVLAKVKTKEA